MINLEIENDYEDKMNVFINEFEIIFLFNLAIQIPIHNCMRLKFDTKILRIF